MSCLRRSCSATNPKLKVNSSSCSIRVIDGGRSMIRAAADVTNSPGARTGKLVCIDGWGAEIASEGVEEGRRTNIDVASSRHFSRCFIHASSATAVTGAVMQVSFQPSSYIAMTGVRRERVSVRVPCQDDSMPVFPWVFFP